MFHDVATAGYNYLPFVFARLNVLANRPEQAVDQLEETLRRRDFYSPGCLRIDSTFAPLRASPRFQRLLSSGSRESAPGRSGLP
jgi:hypothetical protein